MSQDHLDEWEAIEAIYSPDCELLSSDPVSFSISLVPNPGQDESNHVCVEFRVTLPANYPEVGPEFKLVDKKGLSNGLSEIRRLVEDNIEGNLGEQMIFTLSEVIKDWLMDHNEPEKSMHEQAMARMAKDSGSSAAVDEEDGQAGDGLTGAAALLENDLPHDPSGLSPLGYVPADSFTPEKFREWLGRFNAEQERKEQEQKAEADAQIAKEGAGNAPVYSGRQLFQLNLAKEAEPAQAPSSIVPGSASAALSGGKVSMESEAFRNALLDVEREIEDIDVFRED